eukprot:1655508-Amphidinium_carterae.1
MSFSLALGASSLGKPAEETLVGFAYGHDASSGVWLPPQVPALQQRSSAPPLASKKTIVQ